MTALSKSALMVEGTGSAHEDLTVARRVTGGAPDPYEFEAYRLLALKEARLATCSQA